MESQGEAAAELEFQCQGAAETEASSKQSESSFTKHPSDPTMLVVQSVTGDGKEWIEATVVVLDNSMTVKDRFDRKYYLGMQGAKEAMEMWKQTEGTRKF